MFKNTVAQFTVPQKPHQRTTKTPDTIADQVMQQRLIDAINGRKPFANFNHLVHTTSAREQWFDFKNKAYTIMAKQWIKDNGSDLLKKKIKALPTVYISE